MRSNRQPVTTDPIAGAHTTYLLLTCSVLERSASDLHPTTHSEYIIEAMVLERRTVRSAVVEVISPLFERERKGRVDIFPLRYGGVLVVVVEALSCIRFQDRLSVFIHQRRYVMRNREVERITDPSPPNSGSG